MFIKKIVIDAAIILILTIIWVVLNERYDQSVIISGVFFATVSLFAARYLFEDSDRVKSYYIPLWFLLLYFVYMTYHITKGALRVAFDLLKGKKEARVVTIYSKLTNPWYISIVANSITLTPGTVTLDKTGKKMEVLCLNPVSEKEEELYNQIARKFERMLRIVD